MKTLYNVNDKELHYKPYVKPYRIKAFIVTNLNNAHSTYQTRLTTKLLNKSEIDLMIYPISNEQEQTKLWQICIDINQPIMILQPGIEFVKSFKYDEIKQEFTGGILGLNSPTKTTTKNEIQKLGRGIHNLPYSDKMSYDPLPQGYFEGDNCYIIKPWAAKELLEKLKTTPYEMNLQFINKENFAWLQTIYPFYTRNIIV